MTVRFRIETKGSFTNARQDRSIDEPCPSITVEGVSCANLSSYWLEDDGTVDLKRLAQPGKPPYRVPTMDEIRAIPWNGFTAASLFAGGGGSSTGYRMAGFKVVYANEFIEAARDTYRANMASHTVLDGRDIREVTPEDILARIGMKPGELSVLNGSPPCSAFSTAGKRHKGWATVSKYSDSAQRTDDLFFEFARILRGVQPMVFDAENVSGLVKGTAKGYFLRILAELKSCGYRVEARLLDAQWLGVPQARQRLIFVGVREDLALAPAHPKPLPYRYSIRDALPWLSARHGAEASGTPPVERDSDMTGYAVGTEWDKLKPGEQSRKYFQLVRAHPDQPSPTIVQRAGDNTVASVAHPFERRKFSIAELKQICGFPSDFVLTGGFAQQWERCGRAVPPIMQQSIADTIRDRILVPHRARVAQAAK